MSQKFHVKEIYEQSELFEQFISNNLKKDYNHRQSSLASMKNLIEAEMGLQLSFLEQVSVQLELIKATMEEAFNFLKSSLRKDEAKLMIESLVSQLQTASNSIDIIDIVKVGLTLENNAL